MEAGWPTVSRPAWSEMTHETRNTAEAVAAPAPGEPPLWRAPFAAETWRRALYVLVALPVGLACLLLAVCGRSAAAASVQRRLAGSLLRVPDEDSGVGSGRVAAHALLSLPVNAVALALSLYVWVGVVYNLGYPLRPDVSPRTDWGGPSLAGAWAVHAAGGLVFLAVSPLILRAFTRVQGTLVRRMLG
jgi:hypothetical protein